MARHGAMRIDAEGFLVRVSLQTVRSRAGSVLEGGEERLSGDPHMRVVERKRDA